MESIGTYLKKQREMRNVSLGWVAQATKISLKSLQALEIDDFGALPGDVFAKGFVRSYAKAIGLDAEETLLQLEEFSKVSNLAKKKSPSTWLSQRHIPMKPWMVFALFLTAILLAAYLSSR